MPFNETSDATADKPREFTEAELAVARFSVLSDKEEAELKEFVPDEAEREKIIHDLSVGYLIAIKAVDATTYKETA